MKWNNKGHEFEEYAKKLKPKDKSGLKYYIFGAGLLGKDLLVTLQKYGQVIAFIDNNAAKQGNKFQGIDVISLEDYLERKDGQIIIAVSQKNMNTIVKQLEENELKQSKEFWNYKDFYEFVLPIVSAYYFNKTFINIAQISVTERCTLRCKKCAHGCFAVNNETAKDLALEQIYKSADSFFGKVDYIREFVLIGGEPLLYKDLGLAIRYIGEKYRGQIGIFSITTNGTIIPDEDALNESKQFGVLFRISNYSKTLPRLRENYQRLISVLEQRGISYILGKEENEWIDYGFDYVRRKPEEDLTRVFDECKTPCREVRENRFYYCVMARSVSENMGFNVGKEDYLDLDSLEGERGKKELLEFNLGYSEKGYLDMCNYCHGADSAKYPIPVAEQRGV